MKVSENQNVKLYKLQELTYQFSGPFSGYYHICLTTF